ncbi:glutamine-dependent NAD(+) synthetase [Emericellopsis atlantica]|uniref:Glutamine-dependent NAD(+) synthetase n=1 Tax=Emericellopsis atlantica TaxID=2614577 RepID=A0A9P7ZPD9_9HYPO|nr:glutamine-dependent NAD(+) synthetase [Emericellopsis atlantica]KAG9255412.1 glutamine-dependent NAD(+) synthetase [Emericellopsis atlantica]
MAGAFLTVCAASAPSCPLDFQGNLRRILQSIKEAKEAGATLRCGSELEICGYGCLDFHLESDTEMHSWEVLGEIISDPICKDMLIDVGMPVRSRNVQYNCRVLCSYSVIYGIRAKQAMANDGLHFEARHFSAWVKERQVEQCTLPLHIQSITGQTTAPIGDFILRARDVSIGVETCEEMFVPRNPSVFQGLAGAEVILNSSASHAELRKLKQRLDLIANSSRKNGGLYMYVNASGVDGEARQMHDGSSLIILNGEVLAQGSQFSLKQVECTVATVDIGRVRSYRTSAARGVQAAAQELYPEVECPLTLCVSAEEIYLSPTKTIAKETPIRILDPMDEIALATAVFLWSYLVRTNSAGYFLALSGGLDSSTVLLFVYSMARLVCQSIEAGEESTLQDLRRVVGIEDYTPPNPEDVVRRLLTTAYMGTSNSSSETRSRAKRLAERLGAYHLEVEIDDIVAAEENLIGQAFNGFKPKHVVEGGSNAEGLAKQNLQARTRMIVAYSMAQLSTQARSLPRAGTSLLVLASSNVEEGLRGYFTKYDASSADINPLGSISKIDIMAFQRHVMKAWDLPILQEFISATPTAELIPLKEGQAVQTDEEEMGLTYRELSTFGRLRKVHKCGAWSTYLRLLADWKEERSPRETADTVCRFFKWWAINRHKSTILPPSIHLESYSPDDNRHDLRPFLLAVTWPWQFQKIYAHVEELEKGLRKREAAQAGAA